MTRIRPDRLLLQAEALAGRGRGPGRPSDTDLRRAVSVAYYALFHHLLAAIAELLLPGGPQANRDALMRRVSHRNVKHVCGWIVNAGGSEELKPLLEQIRSGPSLVYLAEFFVQLQEGRHEADYDHASQFTKPRTLIYVDMARHGIFLIDQMRGDPLFQLFLALVAINN